MSWFIQAAQVYCFLPLALSLSLNCQIKSCNQFLYFLLLPRQGFLSLLHSFLVLVHVQWTMPWSYLECTSDVDTSPGDILKYIMIQKEDWKYDFCTKLDLQLEWTNEHCWLFSSEPASLLHLMRSPCIWLLDPYLWFSIQGNNFWLFLLLIRKNSDNWCLSKITKYQFILS